MDRTIQSSDLVCTGARVIRERHQASKPSVSCREFFLALVIRFSLSWVSPETESYLLSSFSPIEFHPFEKGQEILDKLNSNPNLTLRIGVTCDKEANAFAMPGGKIVVTSGLLENISSENALAFVLGHEIGHFVGRDHLESIGITLGASIALEVLGLDSSAAALADLSGSLLVQSFSREQEAEADAYAKSLMIEKYGGLIGAEEFFEYAQKSNLVLDPVWLRSHPDTSQRISLIKEDPKATAGKLNKMDPIKIKECE